MERILMMIVRILMNKGLKSGMRAMSNIGNKRGEDSPEAKKTDRQGTQNAQGLRQTSRMLKRHNKF